MSTEQASDGVHRTAHAAIASFLERYGYTATLTSFQREAAQLGWQWNERDAPSGSSSSTGNSVSLESLIQSHHIRQAQEEQRQRRIEQLDAANRSPLSLTLSGPDVLQYSVIRTFDRLHPSNILSLSFVNLPTRVFSTSEARYVNGVKKVICSTGADKNIILSDCESGEMVELYEGGSGVGSEERHGAAVLCTAQSPKYPREFVSGGMDSKVVVWDLLYGKPIQLIRTHSRFVVRCAFSSCGQYLATCSYDRTICIFERHASIQQDQRVMDEDESDAPPQLDSRFELVHTIKTQSNPESVLFVRAALAPIDSSDPGQGELQTSEGLNEMVKEPDEDIQTCPQRTWLAYTMRNDCFIHYVALPLDVDAASSSSTSDETADVLASQMERVTVKADEEGQAPENAEPNSSAPITPPWTELAFNTNESRSDLHVSYSLLHITLHPLGNHISIQTGDHTLPTTGYAPASSSLSRILLMPLLSSRRTTTIWTNVTSSGFAINRHAWLRDGSAAWLTSEDGVLRLVDVHGKSRAVVQAHGAAAAAADATRSSRPGTDTDASLQLAQATSWSRGGNTVIKDLAVLDDAGSVASCGFDHTIRITRLSD